MSRNLLPIFRGHKLLLSGYVEEGLRVVLVTPDTLTDNDFQVACNLTAAGPVALTLPIAGVGCLLRIWDQKGDAATNNVTITPGAGDTIEGASSLVIDVAYGCVEIIKESATNWKIVNRSYSAAFTSAAQLSAGLKLLGAAPAAAADQASLGVADLNGAATAALRIVNEGGGALLLRMMSAAGAAKVAFYDEALADDASITLPTLTNGGIIIAGASPEGGIMHLASDGTCTILVGSTNFVATDTDAKLCVFDGGTAATLRNRLGSSKRVTALLIGS